MLEPTAEERLAAQEVMGRILTAIRENITIKLPPFDPERSRPSDEYALVSVGQEANPYAGSVGSFRYQFEGEEDLLHLIVTRDGAPLTPAEGQEVASFLMPNVPAALIWLKPGRLSQHFYVGHDELPGC